tara:strand:- start:35 stop:430 length:396 start_codon:yes stop_codon:yes gene_type:complete
MSKILIAEDKSPIRDILMGYYELLTKSLDGVEIVGSGQEAIDYLRGDKARFLLTDFNMPGMDGEELVRAALQIQPNLPYAFLTGNPAETERLRSAQVQVFQKPSQIGAAVIYASKHALREAPTGETDSPTS